MSFAFRPVPCALRRLLSLVLLALWLPATAHCSLRVVSDLLAGACEPVCPHAVSPAQADSCDVVEKGDFTAAVPVAHAPVPSLTFLACLDCLHARLLAEAEPLSLPAWAGDHPRDWTPTWVFEHRAAAPARAPGLSRC